MARTGSRQLTSAGPPETVQSQTARKIGRSSSSILQGARLGRAIGRNRSAGRIVKDPNERIGQAGDGLVATTPELGAGGSGFSLVPTGEAGPPRRDIARELASRPSSVR